MSKKVMLTVSFDVDMRVRDRDVRVVDAIDRRSTEPCGEIGVSIRELANELGISADTVRRALASSASEGYLEIQPNHLDNGGQAENTYKLTSLGINVLRAARKAGIIAAEGDAE